MAARIAGLSPDVVVWTEIVVTTEDTLSEAEYGYAHNGSRRKVAVTGTAKIVRSNDRLPSAPTGRFLEVWTAEGLRVIGVCIPWQDAHVATGRKDRKRWEDHLDYLKALDAYLPKRLDRTVMLGDFNQRLPRYWQPKYAEAALREVLKGRFVVATEGLEHGGKATIDHIAVSPDLEICEVGTVSNHEGEMRLSDHFGTWADIGVYSR